MTSVSSISWMSHNKPIPLFCSGLPAFKGPNLQHHEPVGSEVYTYNIMLPAFLPKASYETIHQVWEQVTTSTLKKNAREGDRIGYDVVLKDGNGISLGSLLSYLQHLAHLLKTHSEIEWQSDRVIECIHLQNEMISKIHTFCMPLSRNSKESFLCFLKQLNRKMCFLPML